MRVFLRHQTIVRKLVQFSLLNVFYLILINFNSGFVEFSKLQAYEENRTKFIRKGHGKAFTDAVKQIDDFIADPKVCENYFVIFT